MAHNNNRLTLNELTEYQQAMNFRNKLQEENHGNAKQRSEKLLRLTKNHQYTMYWERKDAEIKDERSCK